MRFALKETSSICRSEAQSSKRSCNPFAAPSQASPESSLDPRSGISWDRSSGRSPCALFGTSSGLLAATGTYARSRGEGRGRGLRAGSLGGAPALPRPGLTEGSRKRWWWKTAGPLGSEADRSGCGLRRALHVGEHLARLGGHARLLRAPEPTTGRSPRPQGGGGCWATTNLLSPARPPAPRSFHSASLRSGRQRWGCVAWDRTTRRGRIAPVRTTRGG